MPYLVAAVVLLGIVALLNLLLTLAVVRRLREHTALIDAARPAAPRVMLDAGETVADFVATTTEGDAVSPRLLDGETLVGFFSPHCPACAEQASHFLDRARSVSGGRARVLAVLVGDPGELGKLRAEFEPVARVVVEDDIGPGTVADAFAVRGFPAICTLDRHGTVLASGFEATTVRVPVPTS